MTSDLVAKLLPVIRSWALITNVQQRKVSNKIEFFMLIILNRCHQYVLVGKYKQIEIQNERAEFARFFRLQEK